MKNLLIIISLSFGVVALFLLDILSGSVDIDTNVVFDALFGGSDSPEANIIREFRLPKALTAILAGSALSVSGLLMQNIFRNPLAGPYVLGVSAGASLGVAVVMMGSFGIVAGSIIPAMTTTIAAWIGAAAVLFVIMLVSLRVRDIMTILILGVLFGSGISAIISILQYFSHESMLKAYVIWTMGSLGGVTYGQLQIMAPVVVVGLLFTMLLARYLNIMQLGEEHARTLGLRVSLIRTLVFILTSLLAGTITAFCGPIGFIGIAVPHVCRMMFRTSEHTILIPGTILGGAALMLAADVVSQMPGSEQILPVNSITALAGIPVIIWVIIRNRKFTSIS